MLASRASRTREYAGRVRGILRNPVRGRIGAAAQLPGVSLKRIDGGVLALRFSPRAGETSSVNLHASLVTFPDASALMKSASASSLVKAPPAAALSQSWMNSSAVASAGVSLLEQAQNRSAARPAILFMFQPGGMRTSPSGNTPSCADEVTVCEARSRKVNVPGPT